MHLKQRKLLYSVVGAIIALLFAIITLVTMMPLSAFAASKAIDDASVENNSSMSTDVIYQIVTDRFVDGDSSNNPSGEIYDKNNLKKYHGGDWVGITQKINEGYFTNMGVSAIWISSPVQNSDYIDPSNGCAPYHGYWGRDFFLPNQYFGTMEEFTTLVSTAHSKDIKVIIDFAPNHTSFAVYDGIKQPNDGALYKNGELVSTYSDDTKGVFNHVSDQWAEFDTWEHTVYAPLFGLADLNQQNAITDQYLKDAIKVWLDAGVDGIRVDAVKHMSLGWQKNWVNSIYDYKPVFIFGEWSHSATTSEPNMENFANESGMSLLDFRYNTAVRSALANALTSGYTMKDFHNTMMDMEQDYDCINDQVTFLDNHDQSRFMTEAGNNKLTLDIAFALQMTSRGIPCVYYGTEQYMSDAAGGKSDPYNRADMTSFDQTSRAYQIISKLAPLRKSNPALAYGSTQERWLNDDVYVYERVFGNNVVMTAINRNQSTGYQLEGLLSSLPNGTYNDVLGNLLGGGNISVTKGKVSDYYLGAGQVAVWEYTADDNDSPIIGNINPKMSKAGNTITITGRGFGSNVGSVAFGVENAQIVSWSDSLIKVVVPTGVVGDVDVVVTTSTGVESAAFSGFKVLSGSQVSVRFKVNNATTNYGVNVYIVGNVPELGAWDVSKAIGPLFNDTPTIGVYPTWFFDISVPADTKIEYKFVKIDGAGNVTWESGMNHTYISPSSNTGEATVNWQ
jgi:glycosidase